MRGDLGLILVIEPVETAHYRPTKPSIVSTSVPEVETDLLNVYGVLARLINSMKIRETSKITRLRITNSESSRALPHKGEKSPLMLYHTRTRTGSRPCCQVDMVGCIRVLLGRDVGEECPSPPHISFLLDIRKHTRPAVTIAGKR